MLIIRHLIPDSYWQYWIQKWLRDKVMFNSFILIFMEGVIEILISVYLNL